MTINELRRMITEELREGRELKREDAVDTRGALEAAAKSLETISMLSGRDEFMTTMEEVRGYAKSRAAIAREALASQPARGEAVALDLTLDEDESRALRDGIGDGCVQAVRLQVGNGHSGYGLYVSSAEYPEDGSTLACEMIEPTTPPAPAVPDLYPLRRAVETAELYAPGPNNLKIVTLRMDQAQAILAGKPAIAAADDVEWEMRIAGPDDVLVFGDPMEALQRANEVNKQYLVDRLKHPDSEVLCVATVHRVPTAPEVNRGSL